MRECNSVPTALSRIHCWNINFKLNLLHMYKNSSVHPEITNVCFEEGGISPENPIDFGKFLIIIGNHGSHVGVLPGLSQHSQMESIIAITIQKLYLAKSLAVSKCKHGKHAWVKSAESRSQLSYILSHILDTQANLLLDMPALKSTKPGLSWWMFAHVEATHIVYVIPPTQSMNFFWIGEANKGTFLIPNAI